MNFARAVQSGLVLKTLANRTGEASGLSSDLVAAGQWYVVTMSGSGNRFLTRGWHAVEAWGTWGNGDRHELRFSLPPHGGDFLLEVEVVAPIVGLRRSQRVFVGIGGYPVASWTFSQIENRGVRTARIPPEAVQREPGSEIVTVEFLPQAAASPRELDQSSRDDRVLGLGLCRFRIVPGAVPADLAQPDEPAVTPEPAVSVVAPAPARHSFLRRALGKCRRAIHPLLEPYLEAFDRRLRRTINPSVEALERKLGHLEQKIEDLAKTQSAETRRVAAFDEQVTEASAIHLLGQRRIEALLTNLTAVRAADQFGRQSTAIAAALERQLKNAEAQAAAFARLETRITGSLGSLENFRAVEAHTVAVVTRLEGQVAASLGAAAEEGKARRAAEAQTAAGLATLTATMQSLEGARVAMDVHMRQAVHESTQVLTQLREIMIQSGLDSAQLIDLVSQTRADVDILRCRNVLPIAPDAILMRNRYGYLSVPAEDRKLVAALADGILPEPGTQRVLEMLLKPGVTFLDVGAHIGMFTVLGARFVGDGGKVISVEPTPRAIECLRQATVLNNIESVVEIHELAASDTNGSMALNVTLPYGHNSLLPLPGAHSSITVKVTTIDTLLGPGRKVDIVKIDVEGAELAVLRGMTGTFASNPHAVAILEFGPTHRKQEGVTAASWVAEVESLGFDIWEIDDESVRLRRLRKNALEYLRAINVLLTRGVPEVLLPLMADEAT